MSTSSNVHLDVPDHQHLPRFHTASPMLQRLYSVGVTKALQSYRRRLSVCILVQTVVAICIFLFGSLGVAMCSYTAELALSQVNCGADGLSIWAPLQLFTSAMTAYFILVKKHDHLTILTLSLSVFSIILGFGIFISNVIWANYISNTFCDRTDSKGAVRVKHLCEVTELVHIIVAILACFFVIAGVVTVYTLAKTLHVTRKSTAQSASSFRDDTTEATNEQSELSVLSDSSA